MEKIEDPLIRSYQLTKFVLLGLLGRILRCDSIGTMLIDKPNLFLPKNRDAVFAAAQIIVSHAITDFNYYVKAKSAKDYFDYKSEFKNAEKYQTLATELQHQYERSLVRHAEDSFGAVLKAEFAKRGEKLP
jgi:hypothetical protein